MFNLFDISTFVEAASSYAENIDFLVLLVAVLVGLPFLIAEGLLFGFVIKSLKKDGVKAVYIDGTKHEHKKWVEWPHYLVLAFDVVIIYFAVQVWVDVKQDLPPLPENSGDEYVIGINARQWMWNFTHAGPDKKLGTADDIRTTNTLHVEKDKVYHFKLTSEDVLHDFSVPVFRLKQDVVPGREITGWFKATKEGVHDIQCAEMCGIGHGIMGAKIIIEGTEAYASWQAKRVSGELPINQ